MSNSHVSSKDPANAVIAIELYEKAMEFYQRDGIGFQYFASN